MKKDLYAEVTARIVAQLESGAAPWVKPWASTPGRNQPHNAITGRRYSGVNVVMLWMAMNRPGFTVPAFATFKQVQAAGGQVRKDEHGTKVYFVKPLESKTKFKSNGKPETFMMLREFTVFNIAQCDGLPESIVNPAITGPRNEDSRDATIEEFLQATGADITESGDRAFYSPAEDRIVIPAFQCFKGASAYYGTMFHELAHWTGSKGRCDRDFSGRFGDAKYAAEELVAELTSAYLAAEFNTDGQMQSAEYIAVWIRLLKDDSRAFFTAASKAQAAADYLRGLALAEAPAEAAAA